MAGAQGRQTSQGGFLTAVPREYFDFPGVKDNFEY